MDVEKMRKLNQDAVAKIIGSSNTGSSRGGLPNTPDPDQFAERVKREHAKQRKGNRIARIWSTINRGLRPPTDEELDAMERAEEKRLAEIKRTLEPQRKKLADDLAVADERKASIGDRTFHRNAI